MNHEDAASTHDDPARDSVTVAEIGIFALLCLMSAATIVTLAIKG